MGSQLAGPEASTMLQTFMERAAAPQPPSLLSPGIAAAPLAASGRQRLAEDLDLLAATAGLPPGFPPQARVLIVEGGEDQIVNTQARHQLRNLLPAADNLVLAGVGHCLLSPALVPTVCGWIEGLP
jgi:pimeloyl-[acyl-carrier protein] methyl ester esterase